MSGLGHGLFKPIPHAGSTSGHCFAIVPLPAWRYPSSGANTVTVDGISDPIDLRAEIERIDRERAELLAADQRVPAADVGIPWFLVGSGIAGFVGGIIGFVSALAWLLGGCR